MPESTFSVLAKFMAKVACVTAASPWRKKSERDVCVLPLIIVFRNNFAEIKDALYFIPLTLHSPEIENGG